MNYAVQVAQLAGCCNAVLVHLFIATGSFPPFIYLFIYLFIYFFFVIQATFVFKNFTVVFLQSPSQEDAIVCKSMWDLE